MPERRLSPSGPGDALVSVLEEARRLRYLGPGPVADQVAHAHGFWSALAPGWEPGPSPLLADLGAGGGVPSLPLLVSHPSLRMVLVDAIRKRSSFLVWAAVELGLADRAEVWCGRVEAFGHEPDRRGRFDAVVARGFAPPSSTLECGAPLLREGGRLVVSEPPEYRVYPTEGLLRCGLAAVAMRHGCAVFVREGEIDPSLPRRWREQEQRPLFEI